MFKLGKNGMHRLRCDCGRTELKLGLQSKQKVARPSASIQPSSQPLMLGLFVTHSRKRAMPRLLGSKKTWLTRYGVQTDPLDHRRRLWSCPSNMLANHLWTKSRIFVRSWTKRKGLE